MLGAPYPPGKPNTGELLVSQLNGREKRETLRLAKSGVALTACRRSPKWRRDVRCLLREVCGEEVEVSRPQRERSGRSQVYLDLLGLIRGALHAEQLGQPAG